MDRLGVIAYWVDANEMVDARRDVISSSSSSSLDDAME